MATDQFPKESFPQAQIVFLRYRIKYFAIYWIIVNIDIRNQCKCLVGKARDQFGLVKIEAYFYIRPRLHHAPGEQRHLCP